MGAPACNTADGKDGGIQLQRKIEHAVYKAAVKIDVGRNALVNAALLADDARRKARHGGIERVFLAAPFFLRQHFHKVPEHIGARVAERIDRVPHAVDEPRFVECLPVQQRAQVALDGGFVRPVGQRLLHVVEHLHHLDVRAAVLGPLQAGQRRGHSRIGIGAGRGNYVHCKRGIVAAAVLGVQHQRKIQNAGLQLGIAAVCAQNVQQVFGGGELRNGVVDVQALIEHIVAVRLIAVYRKQREQRNELQALAQHVFDAVVVGMRVVAVQRQHAARQRVHHVGAGRL